MYFFLSQKKRKPKKNKNHQAYTKMAHHKGHNTTSILLYICLTLFFLILIVCLIVACVPNNNNNCANKNTNSNIKSYAVSIRSQSQADDVLPAIPILTTPTVIDFTRPITGPYLVVPKTANYLVAYTVQLSWSEEATASLMVRTLLDGIEEDVPGSQQQTTIALPGTQIISTQTLVFFHKNTQVFIVAQASIEDSVFIAASDSVSVFTPTTLASLILHEI